MIVNILIVGLVAAGMYSILAVGFALIFSVARILNLAHTAFYMVTAFLILIAITMLNLPSLPSIIVSIMITSMLGVICFKLFFDRVKQHETAVMIISVALALLFQEILFLIFVGKPRGIPPFIQGFIEVGGTKVSYQDLFAIGSSAVVLMALWVLLSKTRLGSAIRAVADDKEIANLMGIDVSRICMTVMGISTALAGVSAAVVAPIYMVYPLMWLPPLTIVLASIVLGGLGSLSGCVIGAISLGYTETLITFLIPGGAFLRGAVSLAIMVVVLMIRPEGLFGVVFEEERL